MRNSLSCPQGEVVVTDDGCASLYHSSSLRNWGSPVRGVLHHCVIVYCVFVSLCLYVLVILCLFISPREPAYKQSLSKYRLSLSVDRLCRLHQQILHQQTAVLGVRVASPRSFCTTGPKENSLRAFAVTDDGCHRDLTLPLSLSLSL